MEPIEITKEDVAERDAYINRDAFIDKVKKRMTAKGEGFREALETLCEDNPLYFLRFQLGAKPFTWQYKVYKDYFDGNRTVSVCCSRQIGKTKYLVAPIELWRVVYNKGFKLLAEEDKHLNKNETTVEGIISRGDDQSIMVLDEIKDWIYAGDEYMSSYLDTKGKPLFGTKYFSEMIDWKKTNMYNIVLKKGRGGTKGHSRIRSVPPTDKIRGFTYTGLVFDECAYIEDYIIESVAIPASKAIGNSRILISTPDKKGGHFYQAIDPDEELESHRYNRYMFDVDSIKDDAPNYHRDLMEEIEDMRMRGKNTDVNREFYCDFTSSNNAFFDMEKAEQAFSTLVPQVTKYDGEVLVGVDLGGITKSHSVITVIKKPNKDGVSERICCYRYPLKKDANILQDLHTLIMPNFKVGTITVDYCPASYRLYEQMKDSGLPVRPFQFTRTSKPEFMDRFRSALSLHKLVSYVDKTMVQELSAYTDDLKPMKGATDDMIDSWMLAAHPILDNKVNFAVYTLGGKDSRVRTFEDSVRDEENLKKKLSGTYNQTTYVI